MTKFYTDKGAAAPGALLASTPAATLLSSLQSVAREIDTRFTVTAAIVFTST
jgi:hypothetical protein